MRSDGEHSHAREEGAQGFEVVDVARVDDVPAERGAGHDEGVDRRCLLHLGQCLPGETRDGIGEWLDADGEAYKLNTIAQSPGAYAQGRYGFAFGNKSGGDLWLQNESCVSMHLRAKHVPEAKALSYLAGYALHNDYSEREFQLERGGQWVKGKSCDSFAPLGPFLATVDDVPDTGALHMWLDVNGVSRQRGTTADMIFDVPSLVSYVSEFMTLLPGDVISTGTPAGVALGMKPSPVYLKAGDEVTLGIDRLGQSRQRVVPFA